MPSATAWYRPCSDLRRLAPNDIHFGASGHRTFERPLVPRGMKYFGLFVALVGLVMLSVFDWVLNPLLGSTFLWRPSVGAWGVICAVLLVLSTFALSVEDTHRVRIRGAAVGFVSPILAVVIGHHGFATAVWLYLPMLFGFGIDWMLSRSPTLAR